jgi:glyoxylate/hydroxypyruvate reductase A
MLASAAVNILFASEMEKLQAWLPLLGAALPHDRITSWEKYAGEPIDIALVATPPKGVLQKLRGVKLIQSLWMGVEGLLADPDYPKGVPLARLVDPGMVAAMSETVLAHILDWHRRHNQYREQQRGRLWQRHGQYMAADRTVGLLGLGELGTDAARKLLALDFKVAGWSRRPKQLEGVKCFTDLSAMLPECNALVCLLPLTAHTRGILNAENLRKMKKSGCLINVARGAHVVKQDLLAALDSGQLSHAYLDVFDPEPLPKDDPLWAHPKVSVTPHTAALTEPRTAVPKIVENIERARRGAAPLNRVDFEAGY